MFYTEIELMKHFFRIFLKSCPLERKRGKKRRRWGKKRKEEEEKNMKLRNGEALEGPRVGTI